MMLHLDSMEHDLANKGVWVTTRFLLLTSELCVIAFGSAFGVREDRVSVSGRWSTLSIAPISSVTRSAFKGSRWFVRQSPSWSALSRLTSRSFSHFTGSRFRAFLRLKQCYTYSLEVSQGPGRSCRADDVKWYDGRPAGSVCTRCATQIAIWGRRDPVSPVY